MRGLISGTTFTVGGLRVEALHKLELESRSLIDLGAIGKKHLVFS